jgi:hypothetical protein
VETLIRVIIGLLIASLLAMPVHASTVRLIEQKIKAGLLYNFLKYTEWPADSASGPLVVCLFGGDAFDGHLRPMAGRTVHQRPIEIRPVGIDDLSGCALLFLRSDESASWPAVRQTLASKDILTVGDFAGFSAEGGMIEFTSIGNRIGIKVNTGAVTTTRLKIQDRLLKLANSSASQGAQ